MRTLTSNLMLGLMMKGPSTMYSSNTSWYRPWRDRMRSHVLHVSTSSCGGTWRRQPRRTKKRGTA